jgi:hypothetical protein
MEGYTVDGSGLNLDEHEKGLLKLVGLKIISVKFFSGSYDALFPTFLCEDENGVQHIVQLVPTEDMDLYIDDDVVL